MKTIKLIFLLALISISYQCKRNCDYTFEVEVSEKGTGDLLNNQKINILLEHLDGSYLGENNSFEELSNAEGIASVDYKGRVDIWGFRVESETHSPFEFREGIDACATYQERVELIPYAYLNITVIDVPDEIAERVEVITDEEFDFRWIELSADEEGTLAVKSGVPIIIDVRYQMKNGESLYKEFSFDLEAKESKSFLIEI